MSNCETYEQELKKEPVPRAFLNAASLLKTHLLDNYAVHNLRIALQALDHAGLLQNPLINEVYAKLDYDLYEREAH